MTCGWAGSFSDRRTPCPRRRIKPRRPTISAQAFIWLLGDGRLVLRKGDITRATTQALVNAANSGLLGGGGVDGAIHEAAGPELLAACRDIIADIGSLAPGRAVITPGFRLPAGHVIHTVGPIWRGGAQGEADQLRSAYLESLRVAKAHNLSTIAFPAISCGAYGFPIPLAAPIALAALRDSLEQGLVREAQMWLHDESPLNFWRAAAQTLLGPPH